MKINDDFIIDLFYGVRQIKASILKKYSSIEKLKTNEDIEIFNYLNARFNDSKSLKETLFRIKNHIEIRPKCQRVGCNNDVQFCGTKKVAFFHHCSCICTQLDKEVRDKNKQSCLEKYGVENSTQAKCIQEKMKETCIKKYGTTNIFASDYGKQKIRETNLSKYGCVNPHQNKEIIEKTRNTNFEKYDGPTPMYSKAIRDKTHAKYHYDNRYFDSSWELAYYIWLVDHNVDFEYHPDISFKYETNRDGIIQEHLYFPDFKVGNDIIEIKGNDQFKNGKMIDKMNHSKDYVAEAKFECMKKNKIKILMSDEIKEFLNYVKNKYGKGYLKSFKNNNFVQY